MKRKRRRPNLGQVATSILAQREGEFARMVPEVFGPAEGKAAASRAYQDARDVVRSIALSYSGTVPPPPWPAGPKLVAAMERLKRIRDGLDVFERRTPNARWPRDAGKLGPALMRTGRELYRELGELARVAAESPTLPDLARRLPDPRALGNLAGWILFGAALYFGKRELSRALSAPSARGRRAA